MKKTHPTWIHYGILCLHIGFIALCLCMPSIAQETPLVEEDMFVDNNNIIDYRDLFLFSLEWQSENATVSDVNKDGKVNQFDVLYMIQSYHKTIVEPTPSVFEEFESNFDDVENLEEEGITTYTEEDKPDLLLQDRMPEQNDVIPWHITEWLAASDPNSAGLHDETIPAYENNQTSILELTEPFNTTLAVAPTLEFDVAFSFEPAVGEIVDFMVAEVRCGDATTYQLLDINNDGEIIDDRTVNTDIAALEPGTFDGLYSIDTPEDLTKDDFITVSVLLPQCEELHIAFRFQSNQSARFAEGVYLDNIRVYDAEPSNPPVITDVQPVDSDDFYADAEGRALISGTDLTPVSQVMLTALDLTVEVPFVMMGEDVLASLPRISPVTAEVESSLQIVRSSGSSSNQYTFTIQPAPEPVIDSLEPNPFFLGAEESLLTIHGSHFRPLFEGASGGSIVSIDTGTEILSYSQPEDFVSRSSTQLVVNAPDLKELSPQFVTVYVQNEYSELLSNTVNLELREGTGAIQVPDFDIEVISGLYVYDPSEIDYPLQQDNAFTISWGNGEGLAEENLNITVGGQPLVINGDVIEIGEADEKKLNLSFFDFFGIQNVALEISPLVVNSVGSVTTEIRVGNGTPVVHEFTISEPQPPLLYYDTEEWGIEEPLRPGIQNTIFIYGDNFRGYGTGQTDPEGNTRAFLFSADIQDTPAEDDLIALPVETEFNIDLRPFIENDADSRDRITQRIPADTVPSTTASYRVRVLNPDSGLYIDSATDEVIQFAPNN